MNSSQPSLPRRGLHPLIAAAAISVIVLCAVGVAAIAGWLPSPSADPVPPQAEAQPQPAVPPQPGAAPEGRPAVPSAPRAAAKPAAPTHTAPATASAAASACPGCGVVENLRTVQVPVRNNSNNLIGTVAGGVVGGVVGNQFGGGHGRDALTVLGAVGGALAGHEIERNIREQQTVTHYELTVRMNDGGTRVFRSAQPFAYAVGTPVRVEHDQLLPR